MIVIFCFILFCLIIFRYLFIRLNKKVWNFFSHGPYGDASTYFFLIQFFRKYNCGTPDSRCLLSNKPVLVPSFFMKVVSRIFSDDFLFKKSWVPNFLFYSIASFIFLFFLYLQTIFHPAIFLAIILLFLIQPDNIGLDKHRIQFSVLQPRYLGLVVNSLLWLIYVQYGINNITFFLITILVILSLNISIFCRQTTFFSIIITSIFSVDLLLAGTLVVGFVCSSILFPKEFLPSLKPQIQYSYHYFRNYYKPKPSSNFAIHILKNIIARPVFESYPYFASLFVLVLAYFFYVKGVNFENTVFGNGVLKRLLILYISISVIFIITGVRKLAFLGECWRYFSFCTYFTTPFFLPQLIYALPISDLYKAVLIGVVLLVFILLAKFVSKDLFENKNPYLISLLETASPNLKDAIWFGVPYRVSTLAVSLGYGKKTFEYQYGNHSQEIHNKYFSEYPFLKWDKDLLKENSVTHVLVEKDLIKQAESVSGFSTSSLKLVAQNDHYVIFSCN